MNFINNDTTMNPVTIDAPPSKSISHRLLMAAALANGESRLDNILESKDIEQTCAVLAAAGAQISRTGPGAFTVHGAAGCLRGGESFSAPVLCDMHESGTSCRLITALLAAGRGAFKVFGAERLHERPMAGLTTALEGLGARFTWLNKPEHAPFVLMAGGLRGGEVAVPGKESSQYASGLLLAAPLMTEGLILRFAGETVNSWPYLLLTLEVMAEAGIAFQVESNASGAWENVDWRTLRGIDPAVFRIRVAPGAYRAGNYFGEGDWSSASYLLAAGALGPRPVTVCGLRRDSLQGDRVIADILSAMGARLTWDETGLTVAPPLDGQPLRGGDWDMSACPDLTPTVAVLAALSQGQTRIFGAAHLRLKESDRIGAPAGELRKIGCIIDETPDGMVITPPPNGPHPAADAIFHTHNDHRLAMSLTLLTRRGLPVNLDNPACVSKSFPNFFQLWHKLEQA